MTPRAIAALVGTIVLTQAFIDLELSLDLGPWHANAPVADIAALLLLPLALRGRRDRPLLLPGWRGYLLFLAASAGGIAACGLLVEPGTPGSLADTGAALHTLVRKPVLLYLCYGVGLAWAVARSLPPALTLRLLFTAAALTAALSLGTSVVRIASGDALWFQPIAGLTPNHKTLAVALSAWLPLLLAGGDPIGRRTRQATLALVLACIALSASKTAWIATVFGLGLFWPAERPLSTRPRVVLPALVAALALAATAPLILRSNAMLDAARSRHSLALRSWELFALSPVVGLGPGASVRDEQVTFPHYRVNGVDAHGVVQKVGAEAGLVGLAGYAWFTAACGLALFRRWDRRFEGLDYGILGSFGALQLNLLVSTETFSPTHWVPFALCWGLSERERP